MTEQQIRTERLALYSLGKDETLFDFYKAGRKLTPEQQHREIELNCLGMINSILAYTWAGQHSMPILTYDTQTGWEVIGYAEYTPEGVLEKDRKDRHSYLQEYVD